MIAVLGTALHALEHAEFTGIATETPKGLGAALPPSLGKHCASCSFPHPKAGSAAALVRF